MMTLSDDEVYVSNGHDINYYNDHSDGDVDGNEDWSEQAHQNV